MRIDRILTLTRPLIALDEETTGTTKTDAICQLGLEIYENGTVEVWKSLINPIIPIPKEASDIHGITDEMVKDAPTFRKIAPWLFARLQGCDFAGKNIKRFDLPLLVVEFFRAGLQWNWEGASIIDVDRLWQVVEPRRLEHAVERFGDAEDRAELGALDAHDALQDVRWSSRVAANQCQLAGFMGWTPERIHAALYPDDFDFEGKLKWLSNGKLAMTFSEHRDKALDCVPAGFLKWMLKADFSPKVKDAVRNQLAGTPLVKS